MKNILLITCQTCGKDFKIPASAETHAPYTRKHCSHACKTEAMIKRRVVFAAPCAQCQKQVTRKTQQDTNEMRRRIARGLDVFCDRTCHFAHRRNKPRLRRPPLKQTCPTCQCVFEVAPWRVKTYCSIFCSGSAPMIRYKDYRTL